MELGFELIRREATMKTILGTAASLAVVLTSICFYDASSNAAEPHDARALEGICVLEPTEGSHVMGTISLLQEGDAVHVAGEVRHLTPGKHGFHVHQFGDLRAPDGSTAGGHYNPDHDKHGGLDSAQHHLGDLGNITADDKGVALVDIVAHGLTTRSIIGRSLVVHAKPDDLHTQPSGDSGSRVAVGVIGYRQVDNP